MQKLLYIFTLWVLSLATIAAPTTGAQVGDAQYQAVQNQQAMHGAELAKQQGEQRQKWEEQGAAVRKAQSPKQEPEILISPDGKMTVK